MARKIKTKKFLSEFISPEAYYKNGKLQHVLLTAGQYETMLEILEDLADNKAIEKMKKKPLKFRKLEDVLRDLAVV